MTPIRDDATADIPPTATEGRDHDDHRRGGTGRRTARPPRRHHDDPPGRDRHRAAGRRSAEAIGAPALGRTGCRRQHQLASDAGAPHGGRMHSVRRRGPVPDGGAGLGIPEDTTGRRCARRDPRQQVHRPLGGRGDPSQLRAPGGRRRAPQRWHRRHVTASHRLRRGVGPQPRRSRIVDRAGHPAADVHHPDDVGRRPPATRARPARERPPRRGADRP